MSPWLSDLFLSSQSDERLVSLACAGHDRAFAVIVERYRPELHAHARQLGSDARAEDIVQQTFLSAFAALRAGTEVKHLRGWLYQIARNAATRVHGSRDASLEDVSVMGAPLEDVVQERALAMTALSEVGRLPDRQKEALVGTVQGRRRADIASSMGLSEGAVRQLVHRARISVRAAVTAVTPYPLVRWIAARAVGDASSDVAITAGAASAAGATMKLGALLASGVIAGGIVVGVDPRPSSHHAPGAGPTAGQIRSGGAGSAGLASPASGVLASTRGLGAGGFLGATLPAVLGRGGAAGAGGLEGRGRPHRGERSDHGGGSGNGSPGGDGRSGSGESSAAGHGGPGPSGTSGSQQGESSGSGSGNGGSTGSGPGGSGSEGSGDGGSGAGDDGGDRTGGGSGSGVSVHDGSQTGSGTGGGTGDGKSSTGSGSGDGGGLASSQSGDTASGSGDGRQTLTGSQSGGGSGSGGGPSASSGSGSPKPDDAASGSSGGSSRSTGSSGGSGKGSDGGSH